MPITDGRQLVTTLRVAGQAAYNAQMGAAAASTSSVGVAANDASVDMMAMSKAQQASAVAGQEYAASQGTAAAATQALSTAAGKAQIVLAAHAAMLTAQVAAYGAIAAAAWTAYKRSNEFETALTNLDTQAGYTEEQMQALGNRILETNSALTPEEWAGAMAPFAYAGYQAEQAWQAAEAAARASEAYMTDTKETAGALLKTMEAYNIEAQYAAYTMDVLAQAAASGTMEMTDLARYIPRVASAGAEAGATLEEMAATLSAISFYAGSAEEATGGLRTLYRALANAGYEARIAQEGLLPVLRDVMNQTNGNRQALQEMLGSAEAVDAFLKLATGDFQKLRDAMGGMSDAAGTVNDALSGRQDSTDHAINVVVQNLERLKTIIGEIIKLQNGPWLKSIQVITTAMKEYFLEVKKGLEEERDNTESTRKQQIEMAKDLLEALRALGSVAIESARIFSIYTYSLLKHTHIMLEMGRAYNQARAAALKWMQDIPWIRNRIDNIGQKIREAEAAAADYGRAIDAVVDYQSKISPWSDTWSKAHKGWNNFIDDIESRLPDVIDAMNEAREESEKPPDTGAGEGDEEGRTRDWEGSLKAQRQYQKDLEAITKKRLANEDSELGKLRERMQMIRFMLESERRELGIMQQMEADQSEIADQRNAIRQIQAKQTEAEKEFLTVARENRKQLIEEQRQLVQTYYDMRIVQAKRNSDIQEEIKLRTQLINFLEKQAQVAREMGRPELRLRMLKSAYRQEEAIARLREQSQKDMEEGAEKLKSEVNQIYNAYQKVIGMDLGGNVSEEIERLTAQTREFQQRAQRQEHPFVANASRQNVRVIRLRLVGGSDEQAAQAGNMVIDALEGQSKRGGGYPPK